MKIFFLGSLLIILAVFLSYCSASKKASKVKTHYTNEVQTLILANCAPCHIPAKGGNKKALDTYESAKANIDSIIRRIELNPGQKGFMPSRKPRLSDSIITAFKKWKTDGLREN